LKHTEDRNDDQYQLTKTTTKGITDKNCKAEGKPRRERRGKQRGNGKASLLENTRMKISQWPQKKHGRCAGKLKKDSQDTFPI
jgi:hypothetical protein